MKNDFNYVEMLYSRIRKMHFLSIFERFLLLLLSCHNKIEKYWAAWSGARNKRFKAVVSSVRKQYFVKNRFRLKGTSAQQWRERLNQRVLTAWPTASPLSSSPTAQWCDFHPSRLRPDVCHPLRRENRNNSVPHRQPSRKRKEVLLLLRKSAARWAQTRAADSDIRGRDRASDQFGRARHLRAAKLLFGQRDSLLGFCILSLSVCA